MARGHILFRRDTTLVAEMCCTFGSLAQDKLAPSTTSAKHSAKEALLADMAAAYNEFKCSERPELRVRRQAEVCASLYRTQAVKTHTHFAGSTLPRHAFLYFR